jgi:hypothetical protein
MEDWEVYEGLANRLDNIESILFDIRELLCWQPDVPQRLWTKERKELEAARQQRMIEKSERMKKEPASIGWKISQEWPQY